MKKLMIFSFLIFFTAIISTRGYAQELPKPSPWAQVSQVVGLTKITITYSRPSVKGRTIFGGLVPYNEVWRTGANKSTQIEFEGDVVLNQQKVPAGRYALFTIPQADSWTIIISKDTALWGAYNYDKQNDLVRFDVKTSKIESVETFTIEFSDITQNSCKLNLMWANTKVSFNITADFIEKAKTNIDKALKDADNGYRAYNTAAKFYLDNNLDAAQALTWAKKSVAMQSKSENLYTLSRAYAANNDYKNAIATATQSIEAAGIEKDDEFVKMNQDNIAAWKNKK